MDMDKIIEKLNKRRGEYVENTYIGLKGTIQTEQTMYTMDEYCKGVQDAIDIIKSETPPCTGSSVQKKSNSPITRIEIKPKFEEKKCKVGYIRADMYPTDKVEFIEEISKVLVGYEEVSNLEIINKINEIIDVINGEG